MQKNIKIILLCTIFTFVFASCRSLNQPRKIFTVPDYTEQDAIDNEKRLIDKLALARLSFGR